MPRSLARSLARSRSFVSSHGAQQIKVSIVDDQRIKNRVDLE